MSVVEVDKSVDVEKRLTAITVKGIVSADQLDTNSGRVLPGRIHIEPAVGPEPGRLVRIAQDQLENVMLYTKRQAHLRPGGRTAIVTSGQLHYGIGRMYEILAEVQNHPLSHYVFKDLQEAKDWLAMQD